MKGWLLRAELRLELMREDVRAYAREQLGAGLRRAGISAEFTLASAVACWHQVLPEPESPTLAMIWNSPLFSGTENMACLTELMEAQDFPMPFQFIASQPHMAAVHASRLLPGLVHAATLVQASGDVECELLPALCQGKSWTHILLGDVWTPFAAQEGGDRFHARWRVLARDGLT